MPHAPYTLSIADLSRADTGTVGGKSANLGELARLDVPTLPGFTTTSAAYDRFLDASGLDERIEDLLEGLDTDDVADLQSRGERIRTLFREAEMPDDLRESVEAAYADLGRELDRSDPAVAVRSSATAEDLPGASFAGQQETFLNVEGADELVEAVKGCFASLFTDRAISYRVDKGFSHLDVKLSAIVQKMGRADVGASGVMFTLDPDSGFDRVVVIEAAYGLGELVVQGDVTPDEYVVFKPTRSIIGRECGAKERQMVRRDGQNVVEDVDETRRSEFALTDDQVLELAEYAMVVEEHFGEPQDVEWLYDGDVDQLCVVQARPETVHAAEERRTIETYRMAESGEVLLKGTAIGDGIGTGRTRILHGPDEMDRFEEGDVLVAERTDPDWEPILKKAGAVVTDTGGKTSHAAIVSRELGVPAVVGTGYGSRTLEDGAEVTVDCTSSIGKVYDGVLEFEVVERQLDEIPDTETDVMLILGDPAVAFHHAALPVDGVGLAREEFIIGSHVGAHPLYLLDRGEEERFVGALTEGIARIAAAFYPNPVVVRLSDFKTDEYRHLEGGEEYEPEEDNPMLGWRGASRYYDETFRDAFAMECEAHRRVREDLGLDNVVVMVPFVRTPEEGDRVLDLMAEFGLSQSDLDVYVMAELPTNVVRADEFADRFDGFSIGTNDLTQLTLGVDRNSEKLAYLFDENDPAVTESVRRIVDAAHDRGRQVGICGDAPSTVPGYVDFLVDAGIDSISVSPDVALETIVAVAAAEGRSVPEGGD
jgi:pyruvate,water dikinase